MAVTVKKLVEEVLTFKLQPSQTLARFSYPKHFEDNCKLYLHYSPPDGDYPSRQPRFPTLNFDGLVVYNCHKGPEGHEFENCEDFATVDDIKDWRTAIKCLQRYCLNLLLAPRRQDFYQIKVSHVLCLSCHAKLCIASF